MPSMTFHWIWYLGFCHEIKSKYKEKKRIQFDSGEQRVWRAGNVPSYLHVLVEQHDKDETQDASRWYRAN